MKKAIVTVINDLSTDMRVHRTCMCLKKNGFDVLLIGRQKKNSAGMEERPYRTLRMKLWFEKGPFFYTEFNIRLFIVLFRFKTNLLFSNDLDTYLPCFIQHLLRKIPLIFDSHEYFTGVPELENSRIVRKIWKIVERVSMKYTRDVITVNDSIAGLFRNEYSRDIQVIRNIPPSRVYEIKKSKSELGLPENKKIILLQGAGINIQRGTEEAVDAMEYLENAVLVIIGSGDVIGELRERARKPALSGKVMFFPKMPYDKLFEYTVHADIGLTLDKDTNINYRFSLPNKLFDYIMARVPVLASELTEVEKIVIGYSIGEIIENHSPQHIALKINEMLNAMGKIEFYKKNLELASSELCWEKEEPILTQIIQKYA